MFILEAFSKSVLHGTHTLSLPISRAFLGEQRQHLQPASNELQETYSFTVPAITTKAEDLSKEAS